MELRHTHRVFVAERLAQNSVVTATPEQAHHLQNVLRLDNRATVRLFNGRDGEFRGVIEITGKKTLDFLVQEPLRLQIGTPDLWLCCAPIKKTHFDYMIEKATELGVSEIQPILTSRAQVREVNTNRAYLICKESAEQCDRLTVPAIGDPVSLEDFLDVFPSDRALIVCAEWGEATPFVEILRSPDLQAFSKAAIVTGPEGGFSGEELEKMRLAESSFFVRLGPRILRADTAALAALACWQLHQGDWKGTGAMSRSTESAAGV